VAPSSSAKKVAKLAQKGKGKKVRFQGGTLFPLIIVIVVVLFGGLVVYARESRPQPGEGAPTANDHWHAALGMYVCDEAGLKTLPKITGNLEETDSSGQLVSSDFEHTGIHSHDDGVMHWHPTASGKATGTNAKLGVYLDNYDITLTDTKFALPASQGGDVFEEGKSVCKIDGVEKDASLKLWVWDNYTNLASSAASVYTTDMRDVRIKNDGMVFMIAFVPDDVEPTPPEWASELPALGAADGSGNNPSPTSTTQATTGTGATSDTGVTSNTTLTTDTAGGEPSATSTTAATSSPTTSG
jgi:hypothetical protein